MTGPVCLQGGGEFSPGCGPMDAELVRRAPGRVVVSALAGTVGADYRTATQNGVRHFRFRGSMSMCRRSAAFASLSPGPTLR